MNTDNRLITNTTVTKELELLVKQFNLDITDVKNVLIAGFKSAFLTFHDRAQLIRKTQREMDEVIARFVAKGKDAAKVGGPTIPAAAAGGRAQA